MYPLQSKSILSKDGIDELFEQHYESDYGLDKAELFEDYVCNNDSDDEEDKDDDLGTRATFQYKKSYQAPLISNTKKWVNHVLIITCVRLGMK